MAALKMLWTALLVCTSTVESGRVQKEVEGFLEKFNRQAPIKASSFQNACWDYETNITRTTENNRAAAILDFSRFMLEARESVSNFDTSQLPEDMKRQLYFIRNYPILKDVIKRKKLAEITGKMATIYSEAKVIDPRTGKKNRPLIPELEELMARSRNYNALLFAWKGWHDATGPSLRSLYKQYVVLSKESARDSNFVDMGAYWRFQYEVEDLEAVVASFWDDIKPLYLELHAFVRYKLGRVYPQVREQTAIPANVLGSMWSQDWSNIYPLVKPFSGKSNLDVSEALRESYSVEKMLQLAESFYLSLRMPKLPASLYRRSLLNKPAGREVVCDTSTWDFFSKTDNGERDVRIKQCATVSDSWLASTHQQLGHAYYCLLYWDKPFVFRDSANPAFHEAIGATISLSLTTPEHLMKIGLLKSYSEDKLNETRINALMKTALRQIAFLPFGYLTDLWSWGVFNGDIRDTEYNRRWWKLRAKYQGIKPPVPRSEDDFDPGAFYPIFSGTSSIRHFLSTVLQFQFHKALCAADGVTTAIHECSIYNSSKAGEKISEMLKVGKSKPWPEVLEKMTGKRTMDVGPLLEYFNPLYLWLREQRCVANYTIGWLEHPGPQYDPCEKPTLQSVTSASSSDNAHASSHSTVSTRMLLLWVVFVLFMVYS